MRIYLTQTSNINSTITSQEVTSAYVTQKLDNGYMVNIGGTEVFAYSSLDFKAGDFLKLKRVESSTSQIIFKVVDHESEAQVLPKALTSFDISHTRETQVAFNLLSELNLPITEERVAFIAELLYHLTNEEKAEPSMPLSKEQPFEALVSTFHKAIADYIDNGFILSDNQLLELLENFAAVDKNKVFTFSKALPHKRTKEAVLKEQLALKAINLLHSKDSASNIYFFALPLPIYQNVYLKVSKHSSKDDKETSSLSFIINTKNLGAILVELMYADGKITASSTFEDKKAMNAVKQFLNENRDIPNVIKAMKLKVGRITIRDFFFGDIKKQPITTGINIKV